MSYFGVFVAGNMFCLALWQLKERKALNALVSLVLMAANIATAVWVAS